MVSGTVAPGRLIDPDWDCYQQRQQHRRPGQIKAAQIPLLKESSDTLVQDG
jgi:hypothetical protein